MSLVSQINLALTRIAQEIKDVRASAGGGARVAPDEQPDTPEGHLWYDTDDNGGGVYGWDQVEPWNALTAYRADEPVSVVTYDGETYAAIAPSTGVTPGTDATKWIRLAAKGATTATVVNEFPSNPTSGQVVVMPDAAPLQLQNQYARLAQLTIRGGGRRLLGVAGISWTQRFFVMGAGKDASIAPDGDFNIVVPPLGTVIQKIGVASGDATSVTVAWDAGFGTNYIPLAPGEVLWWIPPYGSTANTAGEFVIAAATKAGSAEFDIPDTWLLICRRNYYPNYDGCSHTWGDGREDSYWTLVNPAGTANDYAEFANGWRNYDNTYNQVCWRKVNGIVYWRGLMAGGVIGANVAAIWVDPLLGNPPTGVGLGSMGDLWPTHANGFGRIDVYSDRLVVSQGSNGFVTLTPISYWNG